MGKEKALWLVAAEVFLLAGGGWAQLTTGTISGNVRDTSGALLPGTKIVVLNQDTGIPRTVEADAAGHYSATALGLGNYQITAARDGFQTLVRSGIVLTVGQEAVVDLTLAVGAVNQTVEVTGAASAIEMTNATVSALVNGEQIRDLPLNGRSVDQLALLTPGVLADRNAQQTASLGEGTHMSVNGGRIVSMLYLLDGTIVNDQAGGGPGSAGHNMLGVEGVLEFRLLSHNFDAEYGHVGGAVMSQVTRSGTNQFHGSAYEFLRNSIFDARNFFNTGSLPPFRRNQFGAALGGPIKKDRFFFFANWEALHSIQGVSIDDFVPDANARKGLIPNATTGQMQQITVNPAMLPLINLYPLPSGPSNGDGTGQYLTTFNNTDNENYYMGRMDYRISDKDTFFGRYVYNPSQTLIPRPSFQWAEQIAAHDHFLVFSETHIFSAASVNDFRASFNRSFVSSIPATLFPIDPAATLVAGQAFGDVVISNGQISELGENTTRPQLFPQNAFQESETFSTVRGRHSLKFGVDMDRVQINTNVGVGGYRGKMTFASLATFLAGTPSQFAVTPLSAPAHFQLGWRRDEIGWFVQDDIRLRSNLTLNLGIRQDIFTTPTLVPGYPGQTGALINPTDSTLTPGPPFISNKNTYAPRIGLAWDPFGDGKTSVRLGGGIYYNPIDGREFYTASVGITSRSYSQKNPPFPYTGGATPGALALTVLPYHPANPTIIQYSLEIQRQLTRTMTIRSGFIGSTSYHLTRALAENEEIPQIQNGQPFFPVGGTVPNPNFSTITLYATDARANYNAGQTVFEKRLSGGLNFQTTYTFSKAMSNADEAIPSSSVVTAASTMNPFDLARDYSLSAYDQKYALVVNAAYKLPVDRLLRGSVSKAILGGWSVDGIYTLASGTPFDIMDGFSNSNNGDPQSPDRPNLNPGFSNNPTTGLTAGCPGIRAGQQLQTATRWFDPCAFSLSPAGTFGNLGRNTAISQGTDQMDFAVMKNTPIGERIKLQFRAEFFNLFNHAALGLPGQSPAAGASANGVTVFSSSGAYVGTAGVIATTIRDNREIQFGLKLSF